MSSVNVVFEHGPLSYAVSDVVQGGDWLAADPSPAETVSRATPGPAKPLAVALYDAQPSGTSGSGTTSYGAPSFDFSAPRPHVAGAHLGVGKMTAETDVAFGQAVEVASTGNGVAASAGTNAVVGVCVQPGGINAGARGRIRISLK